MIPLDERAHDAIRELVNIASGNAASALAQLLGRRTMISVPTLTFAPIENISAVLEVKGTSMVVVTMQVFGDVTGCLLFIMDSERAHGLSAMLLGLEEPTSGWFDESGQSSLSETANILAGAYAGALGIVLGGMVMISVPIFSITRPAEVLVPFLRMEGVSPYGLCVETTISVGELTSSCAGHIVLLPSTAALDTILNRLVYVG